MDLDRCLGRIGYRGGQRPDIDVLRDLQLAFLTHVPFENLDIHLGRKIVLSAEGIFKKIKTSRIEKLCGHRPHLHLSQIAIFERIHIAGCSLEIVSFQISDQ